MDGHNGWSEKDFVRDRHMDGHNGWTQKNLWMDIVDGYRTTLLGMDEWMDMMDAWVDITDICFMPYGHTILYSIILYHTIL